MGASKYLPHYKSSRGKWFFGITYIFYSNLLSMVINLQGIDKIDSNNTGDGQTHG